MTTSTEPLTSVQMARFVAHGYLRMDAVVPQAMNDRAIEVLDAGIPEVPYGTPLDQAFPEGSFARELVRLPVVAGALASLVGPGPTVDHHAVHIREAENGTAQPLHGDAIIDVRPDAFDVQLMYYPHEVTADMGGTLSVPGSHLRRTNESDTGRYQNLRGQTRLTCPAGTVVLLHHGLWHGGRRNDSSVRRYMFKIRFNPTVPQVRLWDTGDLADPAVAAELRTQFPWYEHATGRLEIHNRILLWRALTGDATFDIDHWTTRVANRPAVGSDA
ncbi:phytanoyl-CoA dioxygenase family protein [Streptomyces beijiangensis]|uniref:Phytanoyl-CoA dioxygenase family protein n=1 Tax=Streptomyces beijiangensis TaxID=163361 RepID=A0A939F8K0_9ACTN|nr:phytanoyl-CoA dioxygenase family protein [Streptomyces beijiangensis]MBO0514042.1 phytanoyl-CoA dioxygenase family protein [Streptomyces beijiangensis]